MITKEILFKELVKNGHSEENDARVWSIADRSFRYINTEMSKAFLKLREHPRYKATIREIEVKLLRDNISNFLKAIKTNFNLIDINCVDGEKAKVIIKALPENMKIRYCPVCVSDYFVNLTLKNIKKENFKNVIDYAPRIIQNYDAIDEIGAALRNNIYQKNVSLLLGSIISNFEINDYLFRLSQAMFPGDILIIGNGIRKGQRFINLETYQQPIFNEWLIHLMRQIGFQDNEITYNARFANNRLEAYYTVNTNKTFTHENKNIEFKKGDKIIALFQYKLYKKELKDFCKMYFDTVKLTNDLAEEYALVRCKK